MYFSRILKTARDAGMKNQLNALAAEKLTVITTNPPDQRPEVNQDLDNLQLTSQPRGQQLGAQSGQVREGGQNLCQDWCSVPYVILNLQSKLFFEKLHSFGIL